MRLNDSSAIASFCVAAFFSVWLAPRPAHAVASAELYQTEPYVFGRYEAKIRYAAGDGVVSSFFLRKRGSEAAGAYWNELDFEKLGADCHLQTNATYGNPHTGSERSHTMPTDECEAYRVYRFEWTPTYLAWFVDDQEIRRDVGAAATAFVQNASSGMSMLFNVWPGNATFGGNFKPAILPVHEYISWVQYSSFDNGAFAVKWREEFATSMVPSGWDTGTWARPEARAAQQTLAPVAAARAARACRGALELRWARAVAAAPRAAWRAAPAEPLRCRPPGRRVRVQAVACRTLS